MLYVGVVEPLPVALYRTAPPLMCCKQMSPHTLACVQDGLPDDADDASLEAQVAEAEVYEAEFVLPPPSALMEEAHTSACVRAFVWVGGLRGGRCWAQNKGEGLFFCMPVPLLCACLEISFFDCPVLMLILVVILTIIYLPAKLASK